MEQGLRAISEEFGLGEVRGKGLLWALELGGMSGPEVVHTCHTLGLLVNAPRPNCLRFMPPLNMTELELQNGLSLLRQALTALFGQRLGGSSAIRLESLSK